MTGAEATSLGLQTPRQPAQLQQHIIIAPPRSPRLQSHSLTARRIPVARPGFPGCLSLQELKGYCASPRTYLITGEMRDAWPSSIGQIKICGNARDDATASALIRLQLFVESIRSDPMTMLRTSIYIRTQSVQRWVPSHKGQVSIILPTNL